MILNKYKVRIYKDEGTKTMFFFLETNMFSFVYLPIQYFGYEDCRVTAGVFAERNRKLQPKPIMVTTNGQEIRQNSFARFWDPISKQPSAAGQVQHIIFAFTHIIGRYYVH